MITIVVHGLLDKSYRQEIVTDGGLQNADDLLALFDVRYYISTQYGDATPLTGWTFQSAPSGMWLGYIERTFNQDYAPAYLMFSLFIPRGYQLEAMALESIEQCLLNNHSCYIVGNVLLRNANWSFLAPLATQIEPLLRPLPEETSMAVAAPQEEIAYCPNGISNMVQNMWSEKFSRYRVVFCGKQILTPSMNIPSTEQVLRPVSQLSQASKPSLEGTFSPKEVPTSKQPPKSVAVKTRRKPMGRRKRKLFRMTAIAAIATIVLGTFLFLVVKGGRDAENLAQAKIAEIKDYVKKLNDEFQNDTLRYYGDNHYKEMQSLNYDYVSNHGDPSDSVYVAFKQLFDRQTEYKKVDEKIYEDMSSFLESRLNGTDPTENRDIPNWLDTVKLSREHSTEIQEKYKQHEEKQKTSMGDDNLFKSCKTEQDYQNYLDHFPMGRHAAEAKAAITRLKTEEEALYNKCKAANATVEDCQKYLRRFPKGKHVKEVSQKKQELNKKTTTKTSETKKADPPSTTNPPVQKSKTQIKRAKDLFDVLTWENVKDGVDAFFEKFEIGNKTLKNRAIAVIEKANKIERSRYNEARRRAAEIREEGIRDRVSILEKELGLW